MAEVLEVHHKIDKDGLYTTFRLSNKPEFVCQIDTSKFNELVKGTTCWYIHVASECKYNRGYIRRTIWPSNRQEHLHRVVMDAGDFCAKTSIVDHKTIEETTNNRKSNLRTTDASGNMSNRRIQSKYGPYKKCAISYIEKHKRYQSYYYHDSKSIYMGSNKCIEKLKMSIDIKLEQLKNEGRI